MYYYIFEPPKNNRQTSQQEDIKAILQKNQVAGEFVTLSLAEKPHELARIGLKRGYSTIVTVGSDGLINQVASALFESEYALGVIPTDQDSDFLKIINCKDYNEAAQALPQRRVSRIDTVKINNESILISKAKVKTKDDEPTLIKVNFDNHYQTETRLANLTISNMGMKDKKELIKESLTDGLMDIYLPARSQVKKGIFSFFSKLKQEKDKQGSIFHPKKASIKGKDQLVIQMGDRSFEVNPVELTVARKALNIIIRRQRAKKVEKEAN